MLVADYEIAVTGRFPRIARLRHEWFEFLDNPETMIHGFAEGRSAADIFTFLEDGCGNPKEYRFHKEIDCASILTVESHEKWWKELDFKVRNKIRKAQKSGVELRSVELTDEFAKDVERIYNEHPLRQGRPFFHYGKTAVQIKEDLSSFPECTLFVGAYFAGELIGFMKLFRGQNTMRTVHIIAKLCHRDKPVMDALISRAVEICDEEKIRYLHYGDWTSGGLGAFREKHGFKRFEFPRYFIPLTLRGKCLLKLKFHHRMRDRLPPPWRERLNALRNKWNALRYPVPGEAAR